MHNTADAHPTPQQRFDKWHNRQAEWSRLAEQSSDAHIGSVCRNLSKQAQEFWSKQTPKQRSADPTTATPATPAGSAD